MGQPGRRPDREGRLSIEAASSAAGPDTFTGAGGVEIFRRAWLPEGDARGVVVIAHGVSEHSGRYEHVARRLVEAGYAVHAIDHRGHGRSEGDGAFIDRVQHAVDDLAQAIELVRGEHPGEPLFLLGHSMGGGLSLELALQRPELLDGLVLSAPLAALEAAGPVQLFAGRVLSAALPRMGIYGVDAAAVSRDPQVVADYEADPLGHHGKIPARTLSELAGIVGSFPDRLPALTMPLLVMVGTADRLVPPSGSRLVVERAGSEDKRLIEYDGLYHEILNEPEQDRVMDDLVAWLDERTRARAI